MDLRAQLGALGLPIDASTTASLERLADELLRWNARRNLTAITIREEVVEKHLVDSLTLLPFARQATRLLDLGTGAGFPALPLKIACPSLAVVAVDSVAKKIDFHRHVIRLLRLSDYTAVAARIEALIAEPGYCAGFDLISARALSSLEQIAALAAPYLAPGGRVVAMKGPEGRDEVMAGVADLKQGGWSVQLHELRLPASGAGRWLVELVRKMPF